jgi:hypothetical protein
MTPLFFALLFFSRVLCSRPAGLPSFYVDPKVEEFLVGGRSNCMHPADRSGPSAMIELEHLKRISASEYFRSHELYAHHYFVERGNTNALRRYTYSDAELEYVPLLPLHWLAAKDDSARCGYKSLISSIIEIQSYLEKRDKQYAATGVLPKFTVASTYNLRTELGAGMPTQVRKGAAWDSAMSFVMSLTVGHYERWPQCPDLLRKSPKLNVELPYVTTTSDDAVVTEPVTRTMTGERTNMFFFSGNFDLFGPEMVCSVRNAVLSLSSRTDTVIVNATAADAAGPLRLQQTAHYASRSVFCLVAKGDSYSTSFFYLALRYGCLPLVVSDWFVFAFPWAVPYEQFVLRVMEADFLLNPHFVLDHIKNNIASQRELLEQMRSAMRRAAPLLSFDRVKADSEHHLSLLRHDKYLRNITSPYTTSLSLRGSTKGNELNAAQQAYTYLPLELLMLEVRYSQQPHKYYNSVPCLRPYMCSDTHLPGRMYDASVTEYTFPAKSNVRSVDVTYPATASHALTAGTSSKVGYRVANDGYQVKGLFLPEYEDRRSHLCRHATRLIGSYKIVFFMQCVRILWPLQPGTFRPVDNIQRFSPGFDNKTQTIARYRAGRYPVDPEGISEHDMRFVSTFHNATKPASWVLTNYPVESMDRQRIVPFA